MFWVYVLKCKNEKYYVGETTIGVKARFKEHINRTGYNSVWTGKYRPIEILWQKETNNPSSKVAGRACYNMAIINEINGDIDKAIQWAQKSYENYNNKLALHYVNILKDRRVSNDILKEQQAE